MEFPSAKRDETSTGFLVGIIGPVGQAFVCLTAHIPQDAGVLGSAPPRNSLGHCGYHRYVRVSKGLRAAGCLCPY